MNNEPLMSINLTELAYFRDRDLWLSCLEEAGVDNWSGYEFAVDLYREYKEDVDNEKEADIPH